MSYPPLLSASGMRSESHS